MNWSWIKSLKTFCTGDFFRKACKCGLITTLELYLNHHKIEIEGHHIGNALESKNLDIALLLHKRHSALVSHNFWSIIHDGIDNRRLDVAYEVLCLNYNNSCLCNKKFVCFDKLCRNECKKIASKPIKRFFKLKIKFKFTALHLACQIGR